jgi:AraC-like DNA-binding protein/ligand-binding sensor protein
MTNRLEGIYSTTGLAATLVESQVFHEYAEAFHESFGLVLTLSPIEALELPQPGVLPNATPFCAIMATSNQCCAACRQLLQRVKQAVGSQPVTMECFAGIWNSAVPIRVGEEVIAFLQAGGIMQHPPSLLDFKKATLDLADFGLRVDVKRLEDLYFQTPVLTKAKYAALLKLLAIFAQHLSLLSNQLLIAKEQARPPIVAQAEAFIADHFDSELSMREVAAFVNISPFHFCRLFKEGAGLTYTEYLARFRIERVKHLLLDPHKPVSDAAYEVGFRSLSQFNRSFHRIVGKSPRDWRRGPPWGVRLDPRERRKWIAPQRNWEGGGRVHLTGLVGGGLPPSRNILEPGGRTVAPPSRGSLTPP